MTNLYRYVILFVMKKIAIPKQSFYYNNNYFLNRNSGSLVDIELFVIMNSLLVK